MAVEGRFEGQAMWYAGTITEVIGDGSYLLTYADGDSETLKRYRVKMPDEEEREMLEVGDEVDSFHGGGERAFAGMVTAVHEGQRYDVRYDDGDEELGVMRELILAQGTSALAANASGAGTHDDGAGAGAPGAGQVDDSLDLDQSDMMLDESEAVRNPSKLKVRGS